MWMPCCARGASFWRRRVLSSGSGSGKRESVDISLAGHGGLADDATAGCKVEDESADGDGGGNVDGQHRGRIAVTAAQEEVHVAVSLQCPCLRDLGAVLLLAGWG